MKIQIVHAGAPARFDYTNAFAREVVGSIERLTVALHVGILETFERLIFSLTGPFQLLYILHTSRTGAALGRYESPALTFQQMQPFMRKFGGFLVEDAVTISGFIQETKTPLSKPYDC